MIYSRWEETYEKLPSLLAAMKAANPGMHYEYILKPNEWREDGRQIFFQAFWCFPQSVESFRHCRPVFSIDGTFLLGKYMGTLLVAIFCDADNTLVPLAFALVEKENKDNWGVVLVSCTDTCCRAWQGGLILSDILYFNLCYVFIYLSQLGFSEQFNLAFLDYSGLVFLAFSALSQLGFSELFNLAFSDDPGLVFLAFSELSNLAFSDYFELAFSELSNLAFSVLSQLAFSLICHIAFSVIVNSLFIIQ